MEVQMEDMLQHEDEYLSGRYDCEALAESIKDLFIAVHFESDKREKQTACLDLRLSQCWQHSEMLQQQIEVLAKRLKPLLDNDIPKLQWLNDRIQELDCDFKDLRLAMTRTLEMFKERMVHLEHNVYGVCVGSADELPASNRLIKPQHCKVVTSGCSCSLRYSEEKASVKFSLETQAMLTNNATISVRKPAIPAVAEEVLRNEDGQDDDCGTVVSKACDKQRRAAQSHCSTSPLDAVVLSPTSLPVSLKGSAEDRSVRGSRVHRLIKQFTDGAGASASCSSAAGVSSCVVTRHSQQYQQLQLPQLQPREHTPRL